jgi:hypothetical protein
VEAKGQQPAVESIVHDLAKPTVKTLAWTAAAAGALALAAATLRNVRGE